MEYLKISEFADVVTGGTPSTNEPSYWNGDIPWLPSGVCEDKEVKEANTFITELGLNNSSAKMMPPNTVLIALTGATTGKTGLLKINACANQSVTGILPNENFIPEYLFYYLQYSRPQILNDSYGGAQKHISQGYVKNIIVPLPPLAEQKKIASVLDKIESLITLRESQLAQLDTLVKSRFLEMFGDIILNIKKWPVYIFSDITTSRLGKMLDRKKITKKHLYPYLANFNVQWFHFTLSTLNEMDFDEDDQKEFKLEKGDLLVCEGGEIGRCAIWQEEIQFCFFQKALHRVRCNRNFILPEYLAWWFKFNCEHSGFQAIEGAKATIAHLPGVKLKALQVATPPLKLQQSFVRFVESLDKQKQVISESLTELETLKSALMQKYFG